MKAVLVRIGVDRSFGGWNAPADPVTRRFLYVPIPERAGTRFHMKCQHRYSTLVPTIERFAADYGVDAVADLGWPRSLENRCMHLDPDFDHLTYGDVGDRRGSHIRELQRGDLVVFYAGLRSMCRDHCNLIYGLVGLYVVDEVVSVADIPRHRWNENAHTRKIKRGTSDIVVRAQRGCSGRFSRFLPVGEFRNGAYRVREDLLESWGGLTVRDGFIQRSARPPRFVDPVRFRSWLDQQDFELLEANTNQTGGAPVVLVLLRRPVMSKPGEMRSDPFWEFGSFGCTGCHSANLMSIRRADELAGVRFGFAQGGPAGVRLVKLTPPVSIVKYANCAEVRWKPASMPFRYGSAPLLINNAGQTDFPRLKHLIEKVQRSTWVGRFSSRFRSSRQLLPDEVAREMVRVIADQERTKGGQSLAVCYTEALPCAPPRIDTRRSETYWESVKKADAKPHRRARHTATAHKTQCGSKRRAGTCG